MRTEELLPEALTLDEAKRLIEAFGSCTLLYECYEPSELVEIENETIDDEDRGNLAAIARSWLRIERVHWEQAGHSEAEINRWMGEVEARLAKAGIL